MDYLVMRLYAPLSSWGTLAVGEDRPTVSYPTRGAILGLLGAALGIKRTDSQKLQDLSGSIELGSKTYCTGTILRDYHTIQTPKSGKGVNFFTRKQELQSDKIETILSSRDYREDGLWVVAVWLKSAEKRKELTHQFDLVQLQQALRQPVFTLYIGRKSCPLSLPLSPTIVSANNLKAALDVDMIELTILESRDNAVESKNEVKTKWGGCIRTNELLENVVSDKWLPTHIVYKNTDSTVDSIEGSLENSRENSIEINVESNVVHDDNQIGLDDSLSTRSGEGVKSQRNRQVTYHWEGTKASLFGSDDSADNVYTHSHWDDPINREQWQFSQRVGHEWTTLEPAVSHRQQAYQNSPNSLNITSNQDLSGLSTATKDSFL